MNNTPSLTIDGSGMEQNGLADDNAANMWLTVMGDPNPWIQYEFTALKQLDSIAIWNHNTITEGTLGWGAKDISIELSEDGENWHTVEGITQLNQAPGQPGYATDNLFDLQGQYARFLKINILSNWSKIFIVQYGLAEVQINAIPMAARYPVPASGASNVSISETFSWRPGRQADQHVVSIAQDANDLGQGITTTTNIHEVSAYDLGLELDTTYYWRVDEVNSLETRDTWVGPTWSFSTEPSVLIENFEAFTNFTPNRPFQTWVDGLGYTQPEPGKPGNGSGAKNWL